MTDITNSQSAVSMRKITQRCHKAPRTPVRLHKGYPLKLNLFFLNKRDVPIKRDGRKFPQI